MSGWVDCRLAWFEVSGDVRLTKKSNARRVDMIHARVAVKTKSEKRIR
jgi:hypothetical protein